MGKPTNSICENKDADQKLISAFVFATLIVQFLYSLNLKFKAFSHLLCLHSLICVGPVRKPHCWFSHEMAHIVTSRMRLHIRGSKLCHMTIWKTCPCNIYPLIHHFYIAKLGYAGVYLFFLFNIGCGYSFEPPRRGGSYVYPQSMF